MMMLNLDIPRWMIHSLVINFKHRHIFGAMISTESLICRYLKLLENIRILLT